MEEKRSRRKGFNQKCSLSLTLSYALSLLHSLSLFRTNQMRAARESKYTQGRVSHQPNNSSNAVAEDDERDEEEEDDEDRDVMLDSSLGSSRLSLLLVSAALCLLCLHRNVSFVRRVRGDVFVRVEMSPSSHIEHTHTHTHITV